MYIDSDKNRCWDESQYELRHFDLPPESYRTPFRKDFARLIHCPSFRRLQGKTQLYPGLESDFFRNRLTHSLEVAQIAKSIALKLNDDLGEGVQKIDLDLIEFAGMAHDIGHPPFGHQGEEALDECMYKYGGFEGNAQTLRVLTRLEKKFQKDFRESFSRNNADKRIGLNCAYRTLASILKYDVLIPRTEDKRNKHAKSKNELPKPVKGYYYLESKLVNDIKKNVLGDKFPLPKGKKFKTIECQIMDIADDIAYSTYDMEDALKAGFYNLLDLISNFTIISKITEKLDKDLFDVSIQNDFAKKTDVIFYTIFDYILYPLLKSNPVEGEILKNSLSHKGNITKNLARQIGITYTTSLYALSKQYSEDGYYRSSLTSSLVGIFIRNVRIDYNSECPCLSKVEIVPKIKLLIEILKTFNYESQILSPKLKVAEYRGKEIVKYIFSKIEESEGLLLPADLRNLYTIANSEELKHRVICDYIASMTDKYCIEYYGRLTSENPETIFKPL